MTAQDHIIESLEKLSKPVFMENIGDTSIEEAIFSKVMSKKYRKLKADNSAIEHTKNAINLAIKNKQPIKVSFLFGGNKLWRFEEAPEIDWAEFFSIIYYLQWMKSIASVYEHGAQLDYYSEDVAVESLNNISRSETEQYSKTFKSMIEWLKPYTPRNVTITYRRYGEEYKDYTDYLAELEEAKIKVLKENNGNLPKLNDMQKLATELNVRLKPGQDNDPEWREKVELVHKSLERTKTIERVYFNDPKIILACPTLYPGWIAVGSTKRSYAKFWAAVGVLRKFNDKYRELVLTPNQINTAKFEWEDTNLKGLEGKNFKKIRVIR